MIKRARTILFLICLVLFLLSAPMAIFYSQGYRLDFDSKKIIQTGGLFLKVSPKQVEIYLDGKLKEKTDFFFGSALIENLLPKKYKIEIKKEGYSTWKKNLEIKEKKVTEVKNVILFPENPNFTILTKGVKKFWFSPDQKKIILLEVNEAGWALKLYDLERNVKSHLIEERDISREEVDLFNLKFSGDSKEISLEVGIKEQVKYFTLELDKVPPVLTEVESPSPPLENIITSQTFNGQLYYLDNFGNLFRDEEKLTREPFPIKPEAEYVLRVFPNFIFLQENQILYLLDPDSKSFKKFFEEIKDLKISPDLKKIAYFSEHEIWILFIKEKFDPPSKKAGERILLARLSEKIKDCFWLNSDYLVFNAGNKIKIAEIDYRDRINMVDIAEFEKPRILFNKNDKKLYLLSGENVYFSEALF